jgi:hypothetical protein
MGSIHDKKLEAKNLVLLVSYPGKGKCADPVNEVAILGRVGGGRPGQNKKRQFNSDTGDGKT